MYALITGASSGLGRDFAYLLAKENYNLILIARRENLLQDIRAELLDFNIDIKIIRADLTIKNDIDMAFNEVKDLDVKLFINNAGFGNIGYLKDTNLEIDLKIIDLNIKATHILTKLYIDHFNEGLVVNISSLAAYLPTPIHATYSATKSYVSYFSRAVNYELKKQGKHVRILTVAPGPIKTDFNKVAKASKNRGMDSKKCAQLIYNGIKRKKELIIPGFTMKLVYIFSWLIPTKILMKLSHKIQSNK